MGRVKHFYLQTGLAITLGGVTVTLAMGLMWLMDSLPSGQLSSQLVALEVVLPLVFIMLLFSGMLVFSSIQNWTEITPIASKKKTVNQVRAVLRKVLVFQLIIVCCALAFCFYRLEITVSLLPSNLLLPSDSSAAYIYPALYKIISSFTVVIKVLLWAAFVLFVLVVVWAYKQVLACINTLDAAAKEQPMSQLRAQMLRYDGVLSILFTDLVFLFLCSLVLLPSVIKPGLERVGVSEYQICLLAYAALLFVRVVSQVALMMNGPLSARKYKALETLCCSVFAIQFIALCGAIALFVMNPGSYYVVGVVLGLVGCAVLFKTVFSSVRMLYLHVPASVYSERNRCSEMPGR